MIFTVLLAVHILLALLLISVILLQQGKGATAGAAFGSGASSTVFGARGSASFLTRLTAILALLFFSNSLLLAYLYSQTSKQTSLLDQVATQSAPSVNQAADVPREIDVGGLIDKVTRGQPVDMPAAPATTPAIATPAASGASAPSSDVPSAVQAPAVGDAPATSK